MPASLILSLNSSVLGEFALDKERITLGRKPENDIQVDNLAVSGQHAAIITILSDSFLEDLDSTNGTFVQNLRGEETFVRRDSTEITGEGTIGLGRSEEPGASLAIYYKTLE